MVTFICQVGKEQNGEAPKMAVPTKAAKEETPPPVPPHRDLSQEQADQHVYAEPQKEDGDLKKKLETLEQESRKDKEKLVEISDEKAKKEAELSNLRAENENLKQSNEKAASEKWELTAANTDLKNKLQQSMALTYMQVKAVNNF